MNKTAGLLGALVLIGAAAPTASAAEARNLQVMQWNMCGVQRDSWGCEGTGTPEQKVGVITYHVQNSYVQAALLQEVCEDDLTLLMDKLGAGWSQTFAPYQWSQEGVKWNSRCGDDAAGERTDRVGTAIVVKAGMADARQYPIPMPWTGLNPPFQCATATWWGVTLCNAHLSSLGANPDHPEWDYRDEQLAYVKDITGKSAKVVFGGDFNTLPPDWRGTTSAWVWPDGLYAQGPGTPGYQECDQADATRTGRATHDRGGKLDYLFSSEPRRWCALADSAHSDHHVLIESVSVA